MPRRAHDAAPIIGRPHAAVRGSAARARRRPLHRRHRGRRSQAYAVFVRSPHAHARIVLDRRLGRARAVPACSRCSPATITSPTAHSACRTSQSRRCASTSTSPTFAPTAERDDSRRAAIAARDRTRALCRRGGRDRRGGERSRPRAMPPRRSRSTTRSCPRSPMLRKRSRPRRRRSGRTRPTISRSTARSAIRAAVEAAIAGAHLVVEQTIPQPAHRQRVHGAARRASAATTKPSDAYIADLRMPGRPSRAASARGLPQGAAGAGAGDLSRRRRRLRLAHQSLSRAGRVVWAARRLGRPVKWTGDRHEAFLTDYTARDVVTKARLALRPQRPHPRARRSSSPPISARTPSHMFRSATATASRRRSMTCRSPACVLRGVDDQHGADGAVPRRRPARGDRS